ncbi:hypothetical protein BRD05_09050 [Halobacteriales archaeon QS_9_70_65]|nr:MAG: hypothetical protein BRD05_09050 [Halobacteriales archaeon QS_9_70_65]
MSVGRSNDGRPYVAGALTGVLAWVLGYVLIHFLAATELDDSALNAFVEFTEGESATYELVGWVFYNTHFVDVRYVNVAPFSPPRNFVGGEDGFTVLPYLRPPLLLFGAGLAACRYRGVADTAEGAVTGALVLPGYLVPSVGVFLFEVTVGDASGAPALLPAIVLAALLYPTVFGAAGGVVAAATTDDRPHGPS